ncbi:Protein of unknown function [Pyronema omphalodes CBS 100304]|uniref:Uncharacterized protein n=1 Tax=Pyronema omphalodes (strain CBS 100304) TaxID=1076935 RepID=U4LQN7_PYROM|nr:Protein of unknown function [Pyronema omphalodes CBS 100304]
MASICGPLGKRSLLLTSTSTSRQPNKSLNCSRTLGTGVFRYVHLPKSLISALVTAHRASPLQPKYSSFHGYGIGLQLTSFGVTSTATTADSGTEIRNLTKDAGIWPTMALSV